MKKVVAYGLYNNEKSINDFEKQVPKALKNHENIVSKKEFERVQKELKNKKENNKITNDVGRKIYGYDYIDGKYQVNEKEAIDIKNKIEKVIINLEKEEKRRNANKSRSEKMKAHWNNEEYRENVVERIKAEKKLKKLSER